MVDVRSPGGVAAKMTPCLAGLLIPEERRRLLEDSRSPLVGPTKPFGGSSKTELVIDCELFNGSKNQKL
jgi:hypothetical protein